MKIITVLISILTVVAQGHAQPCGGGGLTLTSSGGRLGDPWSLALTGGPGASGALGIDGGSGPTTTPFGVVCLDFSPSLVVWPFTLDALGAAALGGVLPPSSLFAGLELSVQAATFVPGGATFSNLVEPRLRAPGLLFASNAPLGVVFVDGTADAEAWRVPAPLAAQASAWLPARDRYAVATALGHVGLLDPVTGAITSGFALTPPEIGIPILDIRAEETGPDLVVVWGNALGGGNTYVQQVDLDTGLASSTVGLGAWANPFQPLHHIDDPGTSIVWLRSDAYVKAVDLATSAVVFDATVPGIGSAVDHAIGDDRLYLLGGGIASIERATMSVMVASSLPVFIVPERIAFGPGSIGAGVLVAYSEHPFTGVGAGLIELDPMTLVARQSMSTSWSPIELAADPAGGGWLVMEGIVTPTAIWASGVRRVDVAAGFATTSLGAIPSSTARRITALPSDTLGKTYLVPTPGMIQSIDTTGTPTLSAPTPITGIIAGFAVSN